MPVLVSTFFGFDLDLSLWQEIFSGSPSDINSALIAIGGWTVLALVFFYFAENRWVYLREQRYKRKWKWVLLAVDIPPMFIQSPKAVEQIFAHLSGAEIGPNVIEKYGMGRKQKFFSLEIISIEGYIQFLIRAEEEFRDLVEAAIYAQYPEAEITEVEDYVNNIPTQYPNNECDIFGAEFHLTRDSSYSIRTYKHFEYSLSKDVVFSDPMAAILENFTRIGHGENFWLQILIEPISSKWKEKGIALVKDIIANKGGVSKHGGGIMSSLTDVITSIPAMLAKLLEQIWSWNFEPGEVIVAKKNEPGKVMDLSPGNKVVVEAIEEKISKVGFKTKMRVLYSGRKDNYNPSRCFDGFVGAMNQFNIQSSNAIVPYKITKLHYIFKEMRLGWLKTRFVSNFKKRKMKFWSKPYILNTEELATLWHFPLPFVKAPMLQKATTKRGEAPIDLPVESTESPIKRKVVLPPEPPKPPEPIRPEDLPYA